MPVSLIFDECSQNVNAGFLCLWWHGNHIGNIPTAKKEEKKRQKSSASSDSDSSSESASSEDSSSESGDSEKESKKRKKKHKKESKKRKKEKKEKKQPKRGWVVALRFAIKRKLGESRTSLRAVSSGWPDLSVLCDVSSNNEDSTEEKPEVPPVSTVRPEEIPPIPENKFLMRRSPQPQPKEDEVKEKRKEKPRERYVL